ncbi:MAG: lysophospholipid acyltransferase family protein [Nitrospiria bacterium]
MLYGALHLLSFIVFKLFFNLKVEGRQNIPKKGGAILASNHASYADILLIGCGIWRRLRYVAKAELFKSFFSRVIWTYLGGIPINRRGVNRDSFKKIIDQVEKKGNLVVIFPEGTRSTDGHLKEAKMGIGMLVYLSGATVIPTYISGSDRVLPSGSRKIRIHPVAVTYGEPVDFNDLVKQCEGKELYQKISSRIMERIHEIKIKKQVEISQTVADSERVSLK